MSARLCRGDLGRAPADLKGLLPVECAHRHATGLDLHLAGVGPAVDHNADLSRDQETPPLGYRLAEIVCTSGGSLKALTRRIGSRRRLAWRSTEQNSARDNPD